MLCQHPEWLHKTDCPYYDLVKQQTGTVSVLRYASLQVDSEMKSLERISSPHLLTAVLDHGQLILGDSKHSAILMPRLQPLKRPLPPAQLELLLACGLDALQSLEVRPRPSINVQFSATKAVKLLHASFQGLGTRDCNSGQEPPSNWLAKPLTLSCIIW